VNGAMISEHTALALRQSLPQQNLRANVEGLSSVAHCGKAAALALFNYGILPLDRVDAMFAQHPRWRSA